MATTRPTTSDCRAAAAQLRRQQPRTTHVYVAVMRQVDGQLDLEIEIDEDTIGLVVPANTRSTRLARQSADTLDRALTDAGLIVLPTRKTWEAHWEAYWAAHAGAEPAA